QLALRTFVSAISVTATGCSVTSTTTVSTAATTGCLIRRAVFFTGAPLITFARAALRALPRLAGLALRSLARLFTFDPFLRLSMIPPDLVGDSANGIKRKPNKSGQATERVITRFQLELVPCLPL